MSLPRDTLKRITGDCDDLTVLFCSLLETVGIETGFITVPGHIYAAFNTKAAGAKYQDISPDRSTMMVIDGEIWIPVEITLVGRGDFLEAWRRGSELWNAFENDQSKRAFYRTRSAQAVYRPVGLKESDLGLQYGNEENIVKGFKKDMNKIARIIINGYMNEASASGDKKSYNRLGIAYVKLGKLDEAERTFRTAAQIDRNYLTPQLNLANIAFLRENYSEALNIYESVAEILRSRGMENSRFQQQVLLNISKVYYKLEQYRQAQDFFMQARVIDPDSVREYSYLASVAGGTSRASDVRAQQKISFSLMRNKMRNRMKKNVLKWIVWILPLAALILFSCPAPIDQVILSQIEDEKGPVIVITSPENNSTYTQTVTFQGAVYDEGGELRSVSYTITGTLGILNSGEVPLDQIGVNGAFSFQFVTTDFSGPIVVTVIVMDWNDNINQTFIILEYPGSSLSSFTAVATNKKVELSWDTVLGAES